MAVKNSKCKPLSTANLYSDTFLFIEVELSELNLAVASGHWLSSSIHDFKTSCQYSVSLLNINNQNILFSFLGFGLGPLGAGES